MPPSTIATLTRQFAEWAGRPTNARYLHDEQQQLVAAALADPARSAQLPIAVWLLGTWHLGKGLARVLDGDGHGFEQARLGAGLQRCSLLLRERRRQDRGHGSGAPTFSPVHAANTVALCLALDDPRAEELFLRYRELPDAFFGADDDYPLFLRELLHLRAGERPTVTPRLGSYLELLLHWGSEPALFVRRLVSVLDVHLARTGGKGQAGQFADAPVLLYPAEAFAVRKVRELLGLPTPKIEHVLMFTNLGQMVPPRWSDDPLLLRVEQELRRR